jgi:hypothetical protein
MKQSTKGVKRHAAGHTTNTSTQYTMHKVCTPKVSHTHLPLFHWTKGVAHMCVKLIRQKAMSTMQFSSHLLSKNVKIKIYKTLILPVVLYGCETWSVTLREEHRLGVSENEVLRRICCPKRDEVKEGWRKLHHKELHKLYSSSNIVRAIK